MPIDSTNPSPLLWILRHQGPRPVTVPLERMYRLREVADLVGLSHSRVRRLVRNGVISASRVGPRGHFRVPASAILKWRKEEDK